MNSKEYQRLQDNVNQNEIWYRWGPYLSERQWGTVREDYSDSGAAWDYFSHDQSRSRAYRWGEDGLGGISDRRGHLCFAFALWNGNDAILKERIFGLTNSEGNHGEDVKDYYFYLDATPTHSYLKFLYKYPQRAFPYSQLLNENKKRSALDMEYELLDTGVFDDDRNFDFYVEYAKADAEDILVRVTICNRGPEKATLTVLPQLWFRNTWSWNEGMERPQLKKSKDNAIKVHSELYGDRYLYFDGGEEFLFTENDTNSLRLYGTPNDVPYVKDAFHEYIIHENKLSVNPDMQGTKATKVYRVSVEPGGTTTLKMRLTPNGQSPDFGKEFDDIFAQRIKEADEFYAEVTPGIDEDDRRIQRQAFAGMIWSKQLYYYVIKDWIEGDDLQPTPPEARKHGRNRKWKHFDSLVIFSMPDAWEYPWFASWDLAFHCTTLALIDPNFAKHQLLLLLQERFMHPNGQIPAYEWNFEDVNPPVHAWATYQVYKIDYHKTGKKDTEFLERVFHKLLMNFTWWVNRKDKNDEDIFGGGFLGLDNIGVFDRNVQLPDGMTLEQSDGTSWMAMYCLNLLTIALELAQIDSVYEDTATKFFEHFLLIAQAMNEMGDQNFRLWDPEDLFYYDIMKLSDGSAHYIKVRSLVGLIPMLAVCVIEPSALAKLKKFKERMDWFLQYKPELTENIDFSYLPGQGERLLFSLVPRARLTRLLRKALDENEFLSPYGLRAVSKYHEAHPYSFNLGGQNFTIDYQPAESKSGLFGGNSNWRGPIWFPINYLIIEALQLFDRYFGDDVQVECPTGSGKKMNLKEVSLELQTRLRAIFRQDKNGHRPVFGGSKKFQEDPHWNKHILFYEYFHGDNGAGIGANHQTGWTGLIAKTIDELQREKSPEKPKNIHKAA